MSAVKRVEIIANHSAEEEIIAALESEELLSRFTKIPNVHGRGNSGPKRGDHIWPEENFILIVYCGDDTAERIEARVKEVKATLPGEGIRCFVTG